MTSSETAVSRPVRDVGTQILEAGGEVSSRAELLDYLEDLATAASAIHHGLRHAAWRGKLSPGSPLEERPPLKEIDEQLSWHDMSDGRSPGEAAYGMAILNIIQLAQALGEVASTAWITGLAEETRLRVDQARAERDADQAKCRMELTTGIISALKKTVPPEALADTAAAVKQEFEDDWQRRKDAAALRKDAAGLRPAPTDR